MRLVLLSPSALLLLVGLSGCAEDAPDARGEDTAAPVLIDEDGDGVVAAEDCDDRDASLGAASADADCDGTPTAEDCDDGDADSTVVAEDGDCDGVLTDADCDDGDADSTVVAEDGDCDGARTADDCDDGDADSTVVAEDGDCDGVRTADDCDDSDADSTVVAEDGDCDGVRTADDCDDSDATLNLDDADGDGHSPCGGDCDDTNPDRSPEGTDRMLFDGDCDGTAGGGNIRAADYRFVGQRSGDYAGRSVANAGDVDGDGLEDVLVGAPYNGASDQGAAYLFLASSLGSDPTLNLRDADYRFEGREAGDNAGLSVSTAGDVDGDGRADLLIGTVDAGAFVVLGRSLGSERTVSLSDADHAFVADDPYAQAGAKVDGAGDVDGDGLSDVLISATGDAEGGRGAGAVYLVLGASLASPGTFSLADADYKFSGEVENGIAGRSLAFAGDVDGDGKSDILVGSSTDIGTVHLFLSSSLPAGGTLTLSEADHRFVGEFSADRFGTAVDSAGDMDGDGLDDLVFGAYSNDELSDGGGAVYVVFSASLDGAGPFEMSDADFKFLGDQRWTYAGHDVAGAGDLDADGLDDLLIGVPEDREGGQDSGAVYVLLGGGLPSTQTARLADVAAKVVGESRSARLGMAISSAGDVDGDGSPDVLVGAYGEDAGGDYAGAGYLLLNSD